MRVISQDGMIDVPYEQVVIQMFEQDIYFLNKNLTGIDELIEDIKLARYSTKAKMQKAMDILHEAYQYEEECKFAGIGAKQPEFLFQFPADKELED